MVKKHNETMQNFVWGCKYTKVGQKKYTLQVENTKLLTLKHRK
jgi:hypothetical protein